MANEVVLKDLEEYQRLVRTSKGWKCSPFMIVMLLFLCIPLAFLLVNHLFGGIGGEEFGKQIAASFLATFPIMIHLFWCQAINGRVEKSGTKLLDQFYGEGWLPGEASISIFEGTVFVTLPGGQTLWSDLEEIVVGKGRWSTTKKVLTDFEHAVRWYNLDPQSVE